MNIERRERREKRWQDERKCKRGLITVRVSLRSPKMTWLKLNQLQRVSNGK